MRITRISQIDSATFRAYKWDPTKAPDFKRVNLVLGWNGSGKTVVSKIINSLETTSAELPANSSFKIRVDNAHTWSESTEKVHNKIRVFNEVYLKNILSDNSLEHLVHIGKDQVDYSEQENQVTKLKARINEPRDLHTEIAQRVAVDIKQRPGFLNLPLPLQTGFFQNYTKKSFEYRIKYLQNDLKNEELTLEDFLIPSEDELKSGLLELATSADRLAELKIIDKCSQWIKGNVDIINSLLAQKVESEPSERIQEFQESVQTWVKDGIKHHNLHDTDSKINDCFFCGNYISNVQELITHFSKDDQEVCSKLKVYRSEIQRFVDDLRTLKGEFEGSKEGLTTCLKKLKDAIDQRLNVNQSLGQTVDIEIEDVKIENDSSHLIEIANKIEIHYVASVYEEYVSKRDSYFDLLKDQKLLSEEIQKLGKEINTLKAKAKNVEHFAGKLNTLLKVVFPTKGIEIQDSQTGIGYNLTRGGAPTTFSSLSEGERNFIGLAYFLLSLKNETAKLDPEGVVVIDDPVSSLDKAVIFQIFALISHEIRDNDKCQYFILTHNLDFYGLLLNEFGNSIKKGKVGLYQITHDSNGSEIAEIDPTLAKYKSDYQYCMSLLWDKKESSTIADILPLINPLRRAWETFLVFKFNYGSQINLREQIETAYMISYKTLKENGQLGDRSKEEFKRSSQEMYRFVNYGSHQFLGIDVIDSSLLSAASKLIKEFFEIIEILDPHHHRTILDL